MTGTIRSIGPYSGSIHAETRRNVSFELSAVLSYDLAKLAVGQSVSFDLQGGGDSRAVNVVVQKPVQVTHSEISLRYMGFEQRGCTRSYRVDQVVPGQETKRFVVTADMGLFTRHHIGLQEGPALCMRSVAEQLDADGSREPLRQGSSLSDESMLAFLERQPVRAKSGRPKRNLSASWNKG